MDYHNVIEFTVHTLYNAVLYILTMLKYRDYRLKLSSDPLRLPSKVPSSPDFSSYSCYVTATSAAHLCST